MKPEQRWGRLILRWLRIEQVYMARRLTGRLIYRDMSRAEPFRIPEIGFPSLHGIVLIDCRRMKAVVCVVAAIAAACRCYHSWTALARPCHHLGSRCLP